MINKIHLIIFINVFLILASCKKKVLKSKTKFTYVESTNLNTKVLNMLRHDSIFYNTVVRDIKVKSSSKLLFWYSKEECNTCTELAFTEIYSLAKEYVFFKNVTVITPELDDREIKDLNTRYDNIIHFITGREAIWGSGYLENKRNLSIFFILNSEYKVENAFYYKRKNTQLNAKYFDYLKNTY